MIIPITFAETVRYFVSEIVDPDTIHVCIDDIRARSTVVPFTEEIARFLSSRESKIMHRGKIGTFISIGLSSRNFNHILVIPAGIQRISPYPCNNRNDQ